MKARFRVLRLVALVSKGLGWLSLMAGLGLAFLTANATYYLPLLLPADPYSSLSLLGAALTFLPFLLLFLFLYGAGGALGVLIAIESNTRPERKQPSAGDPTGEPEVPETPASLDDR
ncbi:MAG: hypothetical protein Q7R39_03820 [Dehalococcoidia bacterium]|nr:hypothetical protein [Dehalococcoidia bacterium]